MNSRLTRARDRGGVGRAGGLPPRGRRPRHRRRESRLAGCWRPPRDYKGATLTLRWCCMRAFLAALLFASVQLVRGDEGGHSGSSGTGCEKRLSMVCPHWQANTEQCLACVTAHMSTLRPNCTESKAELKCHNHGVHPGPPPAPAGPPVGPAPLPPVSPAAGASRPHIVLFVVDDMGCAVCHLATLFTLLSSLPHSHTHTLTQTHTFYLQLGKHGV